MAQIIADGSFYNNNFEPSFALVLELAQKVYFLSHILTNIFLEDTLKQQIIDKKVKGMTESPLVH